IRPARARSFGRACLWRQAPSFHIEVRGGLGRNRTGIDGFAIRYIATLPPGRPQERRCYTHDARDRSSEAPPGATPGPLTLLPLAPYKRPNVLGSAYDGFRARTSQHGRRPAQAQPRHQRPFAGGGGRTAAGALPSGEPEIGGLF